MRKSFIKTEEMEIEDDYYRSVHDPTKLKNTGHAQARVLDRTFVTKGPVISVFNSDDEHRTLEVIFLGLF